MSRRAVPSRRLGDGGSIPSVGAFNQKSKTLPLLSIVLVIVGMFIIFAHFYSGSGGSDKESVSRIEGVSCATEVQQAIPVLQKAYGDSMQKVLHVGPETCAVVSRLWKEEETEAWGMEPYDLENADTSCKSLVCKGIVRVADLARVSMDGLVIFTGYPGQQRAKVYQLSKFGRPAKLRSASWWVKYFFQTGLEESETAMKKFAASKMSYKPGCQIFHLISSS